MVPYHSLYPHSVNESNYVPHIHPLSNITLSKLQRGKINDLGGHNNDYFMHYYTYEPPPIELYTQFPLKMYFFAFWVILFLQTLTIFTIDKIWVQNIPKTTKLWDRILHSIQKASFPFPYTNWHQENGTCLDHRRRQKAVQQEVLLSIVINLLFNMTLLIPLPIFCKIQFHIFLKKSFTNLTIRMTKNFFLCRRGSLRKAWAIGIYSWHPWNWKGILSKGPNIFLGIFSNMDFLSNCAINLFCNEQRKATSSCKDN